MVKKLNIAIIGAGFTGLTAAYRLAKSGHQVTIFEKESLPGGLAIGFKAPNWDWPLEKHYHHLFTSDSAIQNLAAEVGHPISFSRPNTSSFINHSISRLDSPISLLKFSRLTVSDRLRTGLGLAFLKLNPFWQPLEQITARKFITTVMGEASWRVIWEPLFRGKFGQHTDQISAAWFWSRIYKRSASLGYPEGGFLTLAQKITSLAENIGVKFNYSTAVLKVIPSTLGLNLLSSVGKFSFDKIISTLPTYQTSLITGLKYPPLPGLGAANLVLALKHEFLPNRIYWLNICEADMPFLAVVEHTHYVSPPHYAGDNLIYIGNYIPVNHPYFQLSAIQLLKIFTPALRRINPNFNSTWVKSAWLWTAPFAQPVVGLRYSKQIPSLITAIPNLYLANMQQVYPWDRGTNYAVELGEAVASLCVKR